MKLTQTGPEGDRLGELISKVVAESFDLPTLRQEGYRIAEQFCAKDKMWVESPLHSGRLRMEVRPDIFLGIDPA